LAEIADTFSLSPLFYGEEKSKDIVWSLLKDKEGILKVWLTLTQKLKKIHYHFLISFAKS
jgi:hypothetical protein